MQLNRPFDSVAEDERPAGNVNGRFAYGKGSDHLRVTFEDALNTLGLL
jgi:hypothetical protein